MTSIQPALPASADLASFQRAIETFTAEFVSCYTPPIRWPDRPKIIHDALWGTIRLYPWEVAILDLPLVQRLRQIRQTSMVNYVFPGSNHSRFEHTLGVMHQTQKLVEAINGEFNQGGDLFDHHTLRNLRLAALFHDVGHGCFSHISESIYQYCPDMQVLIGNEGAYQSCNAHEVMSAQILLSQPVKNFISLVNDQYFAQYGLRLEPERVANWIIGKLGPGDNDIRYIIQVINGPFDADKLDYIFRDAHNSGLPLTLDLERLWASCTVSNGQHGEGKILTLHRGSTAPLEQILFSKINLFSIVYQHPKVRAAEAMFQGVIEYAKTKEGGIKGKSLEYATDFLSITDDRFFAAALWYADDHPLHKMIHDILYRRHFVRALTISKETIDPDDHEPHFIELRRLNQKVPYSYRDRRQCAKDIWEAAGQPCLLEQIWLDLPSDPPIGEADNTFVSMPSGALKCMTDLFPVQYWAKLYSAHKWRGHVFCPLQHQQVIATAAEKVLGERFHLRFNPLARELAHVPH